MSWFSGSSNKYPEFQEKIEKATSESIPNGEIDFAVALEISDLIRSKQVPAKDAMRLLKRRFLDGDNINMQKSAFKLIDFCIKNGGEHFITEISTKEFMDPLVNLLKTESINESLKNYLLENIQTWSIIVSTNPKFEYINKVYKKLQDDGFEFPFMKDFVDSSMIESKVAPEWQDSDACMSCSKLFTFLNRKHHCRSCGGVFCGPDSDKVIELPELGINIPVRVCDNCYTDEKAKKKKRSHNSKKHKKTSSVESTDDIQKAIELSLKDSSQKTYSINPQATTIDNEEEEELMKAAIAASLQEMNVKSIEECKEPEPKETSTGLYSNILSEPNFQYKLNETTDFNNTEYHQQQQQQQQRANIDEQYYYQNAKQTPQTPMPSNSVMPKYKQSLHDPYQIYGNDERKVVEFVDKISKQQKSNSQSIDPSLIQLQADLVILHTKISMSINKENAEIEKYQTLFSKILAIKRLYDEILQTRLKQEQEMLQAQQTALTMQFYPEKPNYLPENYTSYQPPIQQQVPSQTGILTLPTYSQSYMSPQSTFGQGMLPVHQLQAYNTNIGGIAPPPPPQYTSANNANAPEYSNIPINKPLEKQTPVQNLEIVSPPDINGFSLNNLQYAPIPVFDKTGTETELNNSHVSEHTTEEPEVSTTAEEAIEKNEEKQEPVIANLIDL